MIILAIFATGSFAAAQVSVGGHLAGGVADSTGAGLPHALVRIVETSSKRVIANLTVDDHGRFQTSAALPPGSYLLLARRQAFRARRLDAVEVRPGETTHVGTILLDLAGCDAPGVMCDAFGLGPPDRVLISGNVEVNLNCGGDLRNGRSACAPKAKPSTCVSRKKRLESTSKQ